MYGIGKIWNRWIRFSYLFHGDIIRVGRHGSDEGDLVFRLG